MIKKEKIFELKILEDDEVSGIDSISLVDEPAIEVQWIAFAKQNQTRTILSGKNIGDQTLPDNIEHDFHIPDGEDDLYLERLLSKGQPEQELFDDGWEIDRIETVKQNFATAPNSVSYEDDEFYRTRYKYALSPNIKQSAIIATTRQFCKQLINKNYVWRIEEVESEINSFGQSAQFWRGGYNCRHQWYRIFYKRSGDIINKASANKNKIAPGGFPVELSPEWLQPDMVTKATAANPSPSTVKNLGLAKQKLDIEPNPCWEGYEPIGLKPDGSPNCVPLRKENMESVSDYPDSVKNNAKAVLKYVEENGWGSCGTDVGKQRANQLAKGEPISLDTVKRMYNYLSRHAVDLDSSKGYGDGCGKLMYDSWGGKSALSWAKSKLNDFGYDVGDVTPYVDEVGKKKVISKPLVEPSTFSDTSNFDRQRFQIGSEEKHIVLGPAMIPNQKIFRKDELGNTYYVYFSTDTIKMIAEKYMRNKLIDNNDEMHNGKAVKDVHVLESWIKESENDKSTDYGYEKLPVGTWFVSMKVNNAEIWDKVKAGKLNGFSVSGFFEEVAAFTKEEMFLYKVAEILNKY
jgi:hypothetical protein